MLLTNFQVAATDSEEADTSALPRAHNNTEKLLSFFDSCSNETSLHDTLTILIVGT